MDVLALIQANLARRAELLGELRSIDTAAAGRAFKPEESTRVEELRAEIRELDERITSLVSNETRSGEITDAAAALLGRLGSHDPGGRSGSWGETVARQLHANGESRSLFDSPYDVIQIVERPVSMAREANRLLQLIPQRPLDANAFEYLRQDVRDNKAEAVPDAGTKPTSIYSLVDIGDRARVIAHLCEPFPERYLEDLPQVVDWLNDEMKAGLLDEIERLVVSGTPSGGNSEEWTGILATSGIRSVGFQTDVWTTLRKARTALANGGESPTAWVFNPYDEEIFDLARADEAGRFLIGDGESNVFGNLPRIVSTAVPQGTALLADWGMARLWVRESIQLVGTREGADLFDKNLVKVRAEGRYGFGLLRPSAFCRVSLEESS